ncbi:MAG: AbrB/MazE/SpoVT family DNA-binding domain-containing protein [Chloroflexota bacterium]
MKTRVQKRGSSLALRIPKSFADEVGLRKETSVEVSLADGELVITPLAEPKPTLEQLLAKVTRDNWVSVSNRAVFARYRTSGTNGEVPTMGLGHGSRYAHIAVAPGHCGKIKGAMRKWPTRLLRCARDDRRGFARWP